MKKKPKKTVEEEKKPLKIKGTFNDVLMASVGKFKPTPKGKEKK